MEKLILIGAGGHSKSVIDSIDKDKYDIVGYIDEKKNGFFNNYPILGSKIENIEKYEEFCYFVTIGDVYYRSKWFNNIKKLKLKIINVIDKSALISNDFIIGEGNFIGKNVIVNPDCILGDNNILNTRSLIEHECKIGSHNHISTGAIINGNVNIGDFVFLGSNSVCNGQIEIKDNIIIGSGAVVIRSLFDKGTYVGVPARILEK